MSSSPSQLLGRLALCASCALLLADAAADQPESSAPPKLTVKHCDDFKVNGRGDAEAWNTADWTPLSKRPNGKHDYTAQFKMLYSATGVYVLFDGSDRTLTATMQEDFCTYGRKMSLSVSFGPTKSTRSTSNTRSHRWVMNCRFLCRTWTVDSSAGGLGIMKAIARSKRACRQLVGQTFRCPQLRTGVPRCSFLTSC